METANFSKDLIHVAVYMNRRRGSISWENHFVVRRDPRGVTWYVEPLSERCSSPEDVMEIHSVRDEDVLVGGQLTREILDASVLRLNLDDLYKLIACAFGTYQPNALSANMNETLTCLEFSVE